jgi:cell division protein ZapA
MRLTIMGALMLADEVQDKQARLVAAEARVADMNRQVAELEKVRAREEDETGAAIIALAERIERISRSMSAGGGLPEE